MLSQNWHRGASDKLVVTNVIIFHLILVVFNGIIRQHFQWVRSMFQKSHDMELYLFLRTNYSLFYLFIYLFLLVTQVIFSKCVKSFILPMDMDHSRCDHTWLCSSFTFIYMHANMGIDWKRLQKAFHVFLCTKAQGGEFWP